MLRGDHALRRNTAGYAVQAQCNGIVMFSDDLPAHRELLQERRHSLCQGKVCDKL
jgi:hypothetical protein